MATKISQTEEKLKKARRVMKNSARKEADIVLSEESLKHAKIIRQVQEEYDIAWHFVKPKLDEWLVRLKLYNNQRREKTAVGDPHTFTIHQTILASLIDDKLGVNFKAREEGDEDKMENLNATARYDYTEMEKDVLDYEWGWDASFFGRGLCLLNDFDTESKTPLAEVLDPCSFLRDPRAVSVNGNRLGRGSLRFCGWEVGMTKREMEDNSEYFNLGSLQRQGSNNIESLFTLARQQRQQAQGLTDIFGWDNLTENYEYNILRWFTFIEGERYVVELGNERTLLVRLTKIPFRYWPIIDRSLYPMAHDWDGVSVPDLTEDKQRMRAVLQNLGVDLVKADLNGQYLYHEDRFRKTQDFNFKFGKWIPVKGQGSLADAATPLQTKQISNSVKFIMDILDVASQKATATPELQQGAMSGKQRTLGELELIASKVDTRYSLAAKIFGWSEKRFWQQWYNVYDVYFAEGLGKKAMRLEGTFGAKWNGISRKDIITNNKLGPDIEIESKIISEARKVRNYQTWSNFALLLLKYPNGDLPYFMRKLAQQIMDKDEAERVIPFSPDEYMAKQAVEMLNNDEMPPISLEQDHQVFLRFLVGAKDSPMTRAYIQAHIFLLMQARANPQMFPPTEEERQAQLQSGEPAQQQITTPPEGASPTAIA